MAPLVCIVGSGIIGLASATLLRDAGYEVVIVSRDLPGDPGGLPWASPSAGAAILLQPDATDRQMQADSFQYYWALAHTQPASGVQVVPACEFYDNYADDHALWYRTVLPHYRRLRADELPAGVTVGVSLTTCAVNPTVILPWLRAQLEARGGVRFERATVASLEAERARTGAAVVVNATGLGAAALAGDGRLVPVRGQTMLVRGPQAAAWGNRLMFRDGSQYTYVIPRMFSGGGVILGGCRQPGSRVTDVDADLRADILARVNALTGNAFSGVDPAATGLTDDGLPLVENNVGFRPALRDADFRLDAEGPHTVHAYGFGGAGYVHSFGAAKRVVQLVGKLLGDSRL